MAEDKPKKPDFEIFAYRKGETKGSKTYWTKIGAGWNTDAGNVSMKFEYLPTDPAYKIVLKPFEEREEKPEAGGKKGGKN